MLTRISKIRSAARTRPHPQEDARHGGASALNVYRSLNHIYVQVIDDLHGNTCFGEFG